MSNEFIFVIAIIVAVPAFLLFLNFQARQKLKQKIRRQWGSLPSQPRFDKEESLKEAWQVEKTYHTSDSEVDDLTWYDLDMWAIFELINNTYSSVGSEALYQRLRNFDLGDAARYEELITFFKQNPATRERVQYLFANLGKQDNNHSKRYLAEGNQHLLGNVALYTFLGVLPLVSLLVAIFLPSVGLGIVLLSVMINVVVYFTQKFRLDTELTVMRYLVQTVVLANSLAKVATPYQDRLQQLTKDFRGIESFAFSFRTKGNSEAEIFFEMLNMIFMLPMISYNYVLKKISGHNAEAILLWELLGEMEVAIAILNFRTVMPLTCQPDFSGEHLEAEDIYHPLIANPVANPVNWQKDTLITGSNASGKSTYVKSIALSCILGQTLNTAVAENLTMKPGHVLSSMAVEDDLFEGDSYFVAEIKSIQRLLQKVATGERCYCFIDEILKGTNTIERIAASASVVQWLSQYPSLAFVATHDIELTEILKNTCDNLHFEEQVTDDKGISFDYQVLQGPSTSRNAIALLKVMDYPDALVTNAQQEAAYFDEHRTWQVLD